MTKSREEEPDVLTKIRIKIQKLKTKKDKYTCDADALVKNMKQSWIEGRMTDDDDDGPPRFEVDDMFETLKQMWNEETEVDADLAELNKQLEEKIFVFQCSTDDSDTQ